MLALPGARQDVNVLCLLVVFNSYFVVTNTLHIIEHFSSDVSLAVCNKSDVSVGFIRESRTNFIVVQVSAIYQ